MIAATTKDRCFTTADSPIGELLLVSDGNALTGLHMQGGRTRRSLDPEWTRIDEPFAEVTRQLAEYFDGARTSFDLPLAPRGTGFQLEVWRALYRIPYGETRSYGQLATEIGHPDAARAVGKANGQNPIAVIVPCHRVIGADGSLTGFGGGLERKQTLLGLESGQASLVQPA
jgi:methylated-DNA-[protein]-cysteine S-methyltransferase